MPILRAFADGARRVAAAPTVWIGVYLVTLVVALPLAASMRATIEADLGASLMADAAADGASGAWWQEFAARTDGLGRTFTPAIIGFAAQLDNIATVIDHGPRHVAILGAVAAYLLVWAFLIGGILDRYARRRPTRAKGFFSACGGYFVRLARLAVLAGLAYYALFAYVHPWLLSDLYGGLTRDVTAERTAFAIRLAIYGVFGLLLVGLNIVLDYAKIRIVVEDRRSVIGALGAGLRFVTRRRFATAGLYLLNGLTFVALLALYGAVAPGAWPAGAGTWLALALAQAFLVARLGLKLLFLASQTAYFQQQLAHAEYAASPPLVWPESPAAEAIGVGAPD